VVLTPWHVELAFSFFFFLFLSSSFFFTPLI
jgi:hypothetical protein